MKIFLNQYQSRYPRRINSNELDKYTISPWAKPQLIKYGPNSILSQKISNQLYGISIFNLQILRPGNLHFKFQHSAYVLQLMTAGKLSYACPGGVNVNLNPSQYCLCYFPKGFKEVFFNPGHYEFIQMEISHLWINYLLGRDHMIAEAMLRLLPISGCFRALPTEDFSESIRFINIMRGRSDSWRDLHFRNVTLVQYLLEKYCTALYDHRIRPPLLTSQSNLPYFKITNHENHYQSKRH